MRWRGVAAAGVVGVLTLAVPASAEPDRTVIATADNTFFPAALTVAPNTTIHWENRGVLHNVKFDDGSFEQPADPMATPWTVERHFDDPGVFRYYCENHGGPGGQGMSGVIRVETTANPTLTGLEVRPGKVCAKRTRKCRTVRAKAAFVLSKAARVAGGVDPVGKPAGRPGRDLSFAGKPGKNVHKVSGRGLKPGRYQLTLAAEDENGNESDPATAFFTVKRAKR